MPLKNDESESNPEGVYKITIRSSDRNLDNGGLKNIIMRCLDGSLSNNYSNRRCVLLARLSYDSQMALLKEYYSKIIDSKINGEMDSYKSAIYQKEIIVGRLKHGFVEPDVKARFSEDIARVESLVDLINRE